MLRIVHYIPSISFASAGVGMYMQLLAKELGKRVKLFVVTHPTDNDLPLENCTIVPLPKMKLWGKRTRHVFEFMLDSLCPDLVHVHSCWLPLSAYVQMWSRQRGYRTVYTPHGMLADYVIRRNYLSRKLPALLLYQRKALRHADCIHATSDKEREEILRRGYNNNVRTVWTGVDTDTIALKNSWKRHRKILYLSRINHVKGIEFLLDAVAQLAQQLNDYEVIICGMGDTSYINHLQQKTRTLGISQFVRFPGSVNGEEKWRMFREADVFVMPSYTENFGIAVAEALASGTPVITTKGAPWQDIDRHQCGWWTEVGTEPLKDALLDFLHKTDTELETMGRNGRKLIEEKYSTALMAERMVQLYEEVLAQ